MSNWNNWQWERNIQKQHSSVIKRGPGGGKAKTYTQVTYERVTIHFKPLVIIIVAIGLCVLGVNFFGALLIATLYNIAFGVVSTEQTYLQEVKK